MDSSGLLVFGAEERVFDDVPPPYQNAVRHVREQFDRDAFYDAVDDPSAFVFFGVAPCNVGVDYEWERVPPFFGWSVWSENKHRLLPIDIAERIFDRLGLTPLNTFRKEVNVRDFHPERYDVPESAWYDGPAAGVIIENRRGGSAIIENRPTEVEDELQPIHGDPEAVATSLVTADRIERAIDAIENRSGSVTTEEVRTRVFEMVACEEYRRLDAGNVEWVALRSAIGPVVAAELGGASGD
ncbi:MULTISPECIES: hypothetical protein [Haloferax]|uniref:Uncharacterized protein n=1 Tax=Haloferax marinum TaxID=2666143 RepID=A0A6A8GAK2_9EURY|nr:MULTISPECIES: hypothetical protein [Haloferax]KAB1190788.1 hypothetical protein Hfx1150_16870 [Haloferax sp. CBA1150]MRW98239.1 hypothetical protein [Haloferax marinum]